MAYTEFREDAVAYRVKKMVDLREGMDASKLHVKLSYGNKKCTALVPSVSLIPVADCGRACKLCSKGCYAVRNVCYREGVRKQLANNSAIFKADPIRYMKEIEMQAHFLRFMRWHVSGEIQDPAYLTAMVHIAEVVPTCEFLCFTKQFDIVNGYLDDHKEGFPKNLHIILSGWRGDTNQNPHNLPVSSPVWKDGTKSCMATDNAIWCRGDCSQCAQVCGGCWGAKNGDTILFEAH